MRPHSAVGLDRCVLRFTLHQIQHVLELAAVENHGGEKEPIERLTLFSGWQVLPKSKRTSFER